MNKLSDFFKIGPMFKYLGRVFLMKKEPNAPENTTIKIMHGMNRIAILLGTLGILIVIIRLFTR